MDAKPKRVEHYLNAKGDSPFNEWLNALKDPTARARILVRVQRLEGGNYGDHRRLSGSLLELRLDFGAGYRVYLGERGDVLVVLLCGGDKASQQKDLVLAESYWKEYLERGKP